LFARKYEGYTHAKFRKQWRRDHPFGFFAKPMRNSAGMMDLKKWDCGVPGKDKTIWEGGLFKLEVIFPDGAPFHLYLRYLQAS